LSLSPLAMVGGAGASSEAFVKKWLNFTAKDDDAPAVRVYEPAQPVPSDVPLPPRRDAAVDSATKPQASLKEQDFAAAHEAAPGSPSPIHGALALAGAPSRQ
jgi:hypothetical protein